MLHATCNMCLTICFNLNMYCECGHMRQITARSPPDLRHPCNSPKWNYMGRGKPSSKKLTPCGSSQSWNIGGCMLNWTKWTDRRGSQNWSINGCKFKSTRQLTTSIWQLYLTFSRVLLYFKEVFQSWNVGGCSLKWTWQVTTFMRQLHLISQRILWWCKWNQFQSHLTFH